MIESPQLEHGTTAAVAPQKGCAQLKSGSMCFIPPGKGLVGNLMGRTHSQFFNAELAQLSH